MSQRIDWKNYDYSEGPPRRTRDHKLSNPYNYKFKQTLTSPTPSLAASVTSPADSQGSSVASPPPVANKLTYRPPSTATTAMDLHDTDDIPLITKRKVLPMEDECELSPPRVAANASTSIQNTSNVAAAVTPPSPKSKSQALVMQVPAGAEERVQLTTDFDQLWNEAKTFDEDDPNTLNKHYVSDCETYESDMIVEGTPLSCDFDHFVNDTSVVSTEAVKKPTERLQDEGAVPNLSDDSVGKLEDMEVGQSLKEGGPVSILKNKFVKEEDADLVQTEREKRDHPWDADKGEGLDEAMKKNDDLSQDEEISSKENYQDDKTDLSQYEAAPEDIPPTEQEKGYQLSKSTNAAHNINRKRRVRNIDMDGNDSDSSIEDLDGNAKRADTLKDRTKQAWSKRNQAAATGTVEPVSVSLDGLHPNARKSRNKNERQSLVSFQKDTVHEFVPEEEEEQSVDSQYESDGATEITDYTEHTGDYTYDDDDTLAGRSMHSTYTKSNMSECEDFVKDILFIGSGKATNPGRRQLRYKKEYKAKYKQEKKERQKRHNRREEEEEDKLSDEEDTFNENTSQDGNALEDSLLNDSSPEVKKRSQKKGDRDDLQDMDDLSYGSEGSFGTYEEDDQGKDPFAMAYNYCENMFSGMCGFMGTSNKKKESNPKEIIATNEEVDEVSIIDSIVDYAANTIFPQNTVAYTNEENQKALMDLSISAARTIHDFKDSIYDELHDLDIKTDVKVVKTSVGLPIGVEFAENTTCCWVKRIFENGHCSTTFIGDQVEVGDQLAAVNGVSVMHKNVTDICRILATVENPSLIDLTFVRYIGPLRHASNEQQGYEVVDTKLTKKQFSPATLAKKISFQRPRSPPTTVPDMTPKKNQVIKIKSKLSFDRRSRSKSRDATTQEKKKDSVPKSATIPKESGEMKKNEGKKKKRFGLFRRNKDKTKSKK